MISVAYRIFFLGEGGGVCIRLRSRISDINLARLMRITIEGPELASVDYTEYSCNRSHKTHNIVYMYACYCIKIGEGGGIPLLPPPPLHATLVILSEL